MSFSIPFAYTVAPESRAEFEATYGPDGQWARYEALSRATARLYASERRLPPT
jgi:hypothetical protein